MSTSHVRVWRIKNTHFWDCLGSSGRRSQGTPRAAHTHRSAPMLRGTTVTTLARVQRTKIENEVSGFQDSLSVPRARHPLRSH
eukprot:241056-Prymnesium_polylepis.1